METGNVIKSKGIYLYVKATRDGAPVMLKALKSEYKDKSQFQTLLRKEFETVSKLDHANIAKETQLIDDPQYGKAIVVEFVDGRPLNAYLAENHSVEEKLNIIRQIASAIGYANERNIQHRNLKASNVLIAKQGDEVKVIDFRMPFADDLHVGYSSMAHVSPEQKDGTVAIDARADVYSLGVLMKQMGLPEDYNGLIEKCCSYNRGDRYMDMDSMVANLDGGSGSGPSTKRMATLAAVVVVLIVVVVAFFALQHKSAERQTATQEQTDSTATQQDQQTAQPQSADTAQQSVATAPAGSDAAAATGAKFNDQVKQQMFADMDKMYQPYLDGTATDKRALKKQIGRYYKGLQKSLSPMSNEEQAAFDQAFIEYKKQKEAAIK
ncbi:MAG: protein kinase [Bacteroidales bacterium]|nr:protein kinase [Bacteroidales bacterium]MCI7653171.1 protein kinase [Bacteroidales bacterium]